jgi:UDP-glucose:(heptosyl)LPS alpha-1,3-glucosyltransferase
LKIAFIVHEYNRHIGHARYVAELASRFRAEHEIHVFTSEWEEPDPEGIHFHYVPAWRWKTLTSVLTSILPSTFMVRGQFDIVHSQGLCGFRQDISTAHFIQSCWLDSLRKQGRSLGLATPIWRWVVAPLERLALGESLCRRVIAISRRVQADLSSQYGRTGGVSLIYHGVDLNRFCPLNSGKYRSIVRARIGIGEQEKVALFVGNLQKGAAAAIESLSKVSDVKLLLVTGSNSSKEKQLVSRLGLESRVYWQPLSRQVEQYFASADCFVFPTLYEPFGMVISEAMASGLPVITSKDAGASELIRHGESGWLVEKPWDSDAISHGLRAIFSEPGLSQKMGQRARVAIEPYTWDRCANETLDVYREVIREKKQVNTLG